MTVEHVVVRELAPGVQLAQVVRAGRWVFATGLRALDPQGRIDAGVLRAGRPLDAPPKAEREARYIFAALREGLAKAGSGIDRVVRVDQYYPDWRSVDPYHTARKEALGKIVAPSTSILVDGLLNTDADMDVQALAVGADSGLAIEPVEPKGVGAPRESGYAPALKVGDLVFVAGQLARDGTGNIAPQARVPENQLWKGTRIKLETRYLVEERLRPALEAAGSAMDLVLKAQVYLSYPGDLPGFLQVWREAFGDAIPPTTIVPVRHPAFGTVDASLEVNVIAAADSARGRVRDVPCDVPLVCDGMLAARAFDELLFVSGLMPIDEEGLAQRARTDPTSPYVSNGMRAQADDVLEKAARIFEAAGSNLSNVTRALHFHTDLHDVSTVHDGWVAARGENPLPFSSIGVNEAMFVPGCRLILDLWGYVPGRA